MSDAAIASAAGGHADLAADTLAGTMAIAAHIGKGQKQAAYMLERGHLPAFKIGNIWHMRRSTYAAFIDKLETSAIARATEATMT
jgi:hypothetical protein